MPKDSPLFVALVAIVAFGCDAPTGQAPEPDAALVPLWASQSPLQDAWSSRLYPEDWSPPERPGQGALHDFSWAGYRHGEVPTVPAGPVYSVLDEGADPTGARDSQPAFAAAVERAQDGGIVFVPEGLYRLASPLVVRHSGVVIAGEGAGKSRVFFSQIAAMGDRGHLSFEGALMQEGEAVLLEDGLPGERSVLVSGGVDYDVGDDIVLGFEISDAFVEAHGMVGTWQAFNGRWQAFSRRRVVALEAQGDALRLHFEVPLRQAHLRRDSASVRRELGVLREVGVVDLGLSNANDYDAIWSQNRIRLLSFEGVADAFVSGVHSFVSPLAPPEAPEAEVASGGIFVGSSKSVSVLRSRIGRAVHRGPGGNGYLFEVRQSNEVLFEDCEGEAGRHNFIQNWGFGTSGCVWHRVHSRDGRAETGPRSTFGTLGYSEFHHSLATANLIDGCTLDDGWAAVNRGHWSSGAGESATENVFWNNRGTGTIRSAQFGWGYVVGTEPSLRVGAHLWEADAAPSDHVEGLGFGATLEPPSLYEDQRRRRLEGSAAGEP